MWYGKDNSLLPMDHEIALRLKAAGFPQKGNGKERCGHFITEAGDRSDHGRVCREWAYHPTEGELIEALPKNVTGGDLTITPSRTGTGWCVSYYSFDEHLFMSSPCSGPTVQAALAEQWLIFHSHENP